jgi:hypothetical protein
MRSVITLFAADEGFFDIVSPFINYIENSVDWDRIAKLGLSPAHQLIFDWAKICWQNEIPQGTNPFEAIMSCDAPLRKSVARALAIRWDVSK